MAVGAGSLISTPHDLNVFYAALFGGELLPPAQLDEMTATVEAPALGLRYGLGVGELPLPCGGGYFGHPGELLGFRTWVGTTLDGTRTATVYATSDGGPTRSRPCATSWSSTCAGPTPRTAGRRRRRRGRQRVSGVAPVAARDRSHSRAADSRSIAYARTPPSSMGASGSATGATSQSSR